MAPAFPKSLACPHFLACTGRVRQTCSDLQVGFLGESLSEPSVVELAHSAIRRSSAISGEVKRESAC